MFLNKMTLANLVVFIAIGLVCFVTPTMAATFPTGVDTIPDISKKQGQAIDITFPIATAAGDGALTASLTPTGGSAVAPSTADPPVAETTGPLRGLAFTFANGVGKLKGNASPELVTRVLVTYTVSEADDSSGTPASIPDDTLTFTFEVTPADPLMFPGGADIADKELRVGEAFGEVLPAAVDGIGPLSYSIVGATDTAGVFSGGPLPTGISFTASSRLLTGIPTIPAARAVVTYRVTDSTVGTSDTADLTFTITVTPRPTGPSFAPLTKVPDKAYTKGTAIEAYTLPAASETYAVGAVTYTLTGLPTGLSFDPTTRMLTGTPNPTNTGDTTATYTATDAARNSDDVLFKITVNPVVSPVAPPNFPAAGTSYLLGQRFVDITVSNATGGTGDPADYTYAVTGLPDGLMFAAMKITGTPTATGSSTVTITATDTVMAMGSADFTITVTAAPTLSFSHVIVPQTYEVGKPIPPMLLPQGVGGIPPHTYTLVPLPEGLNFSPTTRLLSGTPRTAQPATDHIYTISDSAFSHITSPGANQVPNTITLPISITVTAPAQPTNRPPDFGTATVANLVATAGTAIPGRFLPEATDADGDTLTYSIVETLPNGLTFNALNRALTGTPTTAMTETAYTYKVEDGNGGMDTIGFFITVNAGTPTPDPTNRPPAFAATARISFIVARVGTAIPSRTLPAATDPDGDTLTYSISPALPTGLTFNSGTRVLMGTPTAAMAQTAYTYKVEDGNGGEDTINFSITVNATAPPTLPTDVDGDGQVTVIDLAMVALFYGTQVPAGVSLAADVNSDGVVNILDLTAVAQGIDATSGGANSLSLEAVKAAVAAAAEQAEALEGVAAAPMHFSIRPDGLSHGTSAYLNVANALAEARHPEVSDVLSKFLELLAEAKAIPETSALLPNYPNPFNPETWIPYHLAKAADVAVTIYDVRGSVVRELVLGHQPTGLYVSRGRAAYWDGKNQLGEKVASGLYFYTLTAGDFTATRKLLIAK